MMMKWKRAVVDKKVQNLLECVEVGLVSRNAD